MFDLSAASRTIVSALSALVISTLCVTAAVAPARAAAPVASAATDASTPPR